MNDDYSIGQASAAVAMANDAIDNARRAAASSRSRREQNNAAPPPPPPSSTQNNNYNGASSSSFSKPHYQPSSFNTPRTPNPNPVPGTAEYVKNSPSSGGAQSDLDLKHNDNAYHVIATLVTERLLPKIDIDSTTHYTLTSDDVAFFQKMLPYSVRRSFVDALRYRTQLLKSGVGSRNSNLGKLTMQCQMLGLDRENLNVLLDLSSSAGMSYPINFKNQGPVAVPSPRNDPYDNNDQYNNIDANNGTQQSYNVNTSGADNGVTFGLSSPMAFTPNTTTFSPTNNSTGVSMGRSNSNFGLGQSNHSTTNEWETSAESLARQQIMAEINETKFLMSGSVTPDAVNFWKKHLEELSQRLVALSLEEQLKAAGSNAGGGGSVAGSVGGMGSNVGMSHDHGGYGNGNANHSMDIHNKVKKHYNNKPQIQSQSEYLENNRRMREEMGMGSGVVASPASMSAMESGVGSYHHPNQQGGHVMEANVEVVQSQSMPKKPLDELPVCDVVAPSDLPGGYMFEAQLGSKKFLATVPPGGVTKGQRFVSTMRELETIEIPVPLGAWRDGGKECLNHGVFHPLFMNTLFFPCIALGQIMTRAGLDWQGEPANKLVSSLSCANMTVLLMFWLAMNASAAFMIRVAWERGMLIGGEYYVPLIFFNFFLLTCMINLTRKVRASIRNKYQIPEERCEGLEDCMCATFCMPCAICQMGRHTADFDTYRATCCTKTGLPRQVELAPVTFYEDQYQNMNEESREAGHMI